MGSSLRKRWTLLWLSSSKKIFFKQTSANNIWRYLYFKQTFIYNIYTTLPWYLSTNMVPFIPVLRNFEVDLWDNFYQNKQKYFYIYLSYKMSQGSVGFQCVFPSVGQPYLETFRRLQKKWGWYQHVLWKYKHLCVIFGGGFW